ncbi:hypothetical protein ACIRP4_09130 [Streptomyces bacillaris]|uniref:hypothetical protein n=1 Tax=Streptomyces bacillaris TaxID=68179 RepID=UPI00380D2DD4
MGEWGTVQEPEGAEPLTIAADEVVRVHGMSRTLAQQAQGERLGSLAYRWGLLPMCAEYVSRGAAEEALASSPW